MADKGINFRASASLPPLTDGANETYCIGDTYPTTRNGITFGWESGTIEPRDRTVDHGVNVAGTNFTATLDATFRIDLPQAGNYLIRAAFGDMSTNTNRTNWSMQDGTTEFAFVDLQPAVTGDMKDATNVSVDCTNDNWKNNNTGVTHTFVSTIFRIEMFENGINNCVAHLDYEFLGSAGVTYILT